MFGRRTRIPPGPSVIALRTGAPLIPAVIYMREDGSWHAWVQEALTVEGSADDPEAVTATATKLAAAFEQLVLRAPTQWHAMFNRYWL